LRINNPGYSDYVRKNIFLTLLSDYVRNILDTDYYEMIDFGTFTDGIFLAKGHPAVISSRPGPPSPSRSGGA
jgi:hypothetical protein